MFKTTKENIPQIKATIKAYSECWFHGCGNIYAEQSASDFRQKFTNPNSEESTYRIHFTSINQVPDTVEQLNKMLMTSRSQEIVKEKMPKASQTIKTISVEQDEAPIKKGKEKAQKTEEPIELTEAEKEAAEFQRLLAEENANKGK
jgi:hypothetical protein